MKAKDSDGLVNETFKQKVLRKLYPLLRRIGKNGKNGTILINRLNLEPLTSFYDLSIILNTGKVLDFSDLKGCKVILVNTASDCGYTSQYSELQSLYEKFDHKLKIIAFPSNDFAGQEKSNDAAIAGFCQLNYGVTFPLALKGTVLKKQEQQLVFKWLTNKDINGWNDHEPDWNFAKYVINQKGILTHYFGPSVSPLDKVFLESLSWSG